MQSPPPYDWRTDQKAMCKNCAKWLYHSQICNEIEKCKRWVAWGRIIERMINKRIKNENDK